MHYLVGPKLSCASMDVLCRDYLHDHSVPYPSFVSLSCYCAILIPRNFVNFASKLLRLWYVPLNDDVAYCARTTRCPLSCTQRNYSLQQDGYVPIGHYDSLDDDNLDISSGGVLQNCFPTVLTGTNPIKFKSMCPFPVVMLTTFRLNINSR